MKVRDRFVALLTLFWISFGAAISPASQVQQETPEEQQKRAAALQKKATLLLEQVIAESRVLRLLENRVSVLISGGDLLWDRDQPRARSFFVEAAAGVTEMMQRTEPNDRPAFGPMSSGNQSRRDLLMTVARRDPALAYQFLQSIPQPPSNNRDGRRPDTEAALEQVLTAQIAAADPQLAVKNAQEWLNKGQYPSAIARVLSQVQTKDQKLGAKFAGAVLSRLQSEDLLANQDAARLSLNLLQPGPLPSDVNPGPGQQQPARRDSRALDESSYRDLMETVIASALRATPDAMGGGRAGRGGPNGGGPNNRRGGPQNLPATPGDAQNRQGNARALLTGLQSLLPQVDQYLPARSSALRQKMTELGLADDQRELRGQLGNLMQQGTSDSILAAAGSAPQPLQARMYQQAALKALNEGNADRARQIANDHLDGNTRNSVLQTIDLGEKASSISANSLEEIRRSLYRLPSDEERVRLLLPLVKTAQANNPKLALQLVDEARNLVSRRAANYRQFNLQLDVASTCIPVDPARAFDLLGFGISQLNELLSAAALLSGFEVNIFRDGELPVEEATSSLTSMVSRYGQVLAELAKTDFERAQTTADGFQLPEARIIARLNIVRGVLGIPSGRGGESGFGGPFGGGRGFGPNPAFPRQQ